MVLYLNIVNHVVNKETNPAGEAEEEGEDDEKYGETGEDEIQDEEQEVLTVVIRITHCPHWPALLSEQRRHVLPISPELVCSPLLHKQQEKLYSRLERLLRREKNNIQRNSEGGMDTK